MFTSERLHSELKHGGVRAPVIVVVVVGVVVVVVVVIWWPRNLTVNLYGFCTRIAS